MTRNEYLQALEKQLKHLPQDDFQDTMDYFHEYFDEAGLENEQAVINELGSPKEAAREILANLYDKKRAEAKTKPRNMVLLIILSILAAPIGLPLAFTLVALLICLLLLILSAYILIAALWIALFSLGLASALLAADMWSLSWSTSLLFMGMALMGIPLSILGTQFTIHFGNKAFLFVLHWIQRHIRKGVRYETV